jgi:predicted DNA-binding protein
VGGLQSKGTAVKPIRFSVEMVKQVEQKIGKTKSFSEYVRECVERDLGK